MESAQNKQLLTLENKINNLEAQIQQIIKKLEVLEEKYQRNQEKNET